LIWDNETFQDGVDILSDEFYTRLKTSKSMPTTSQVPVVVMQSIFKSLIEKEFEVLGIFVSAKLSGTLQSAAHAKEMLGSSAGDKVHIVDSQSTSMALGLQVISAARAAEAGMDIQECVKIAEKAHERSGLFFAVDTLEFLHRGGRIGGGQKFLGTMLNLKPILAVQNGRVEGIERIRTKSKAHDRVLELISEQVKGKSNIRLATLHANAPDDAKALLARVSKAVNPAETIFAEVSPVVGTHAGPGTVGIAYIFD
jgi:DegV family protein with EDD domain